MGRIQVVLRDDVEEKLREAIFKNRGMKKGNISQVVEEAVEEWVKKHQKPK